MINLRGGPRMHSAAYLAPETKQPIEHADSFERTLSQMRTGHHQWYCLKSPKSVQGCQIRSTDKRKAPSPKDPQTAKSFCRACRSCSQGDGAHVDSRGTEHRYSNRALANRTAHSAREQSAHPRRAQVASIAASMRDWGWTNPILVGAERRHHRGPCVRLLVAEELGMKEVPIVPPE